MAAMLFLVMNRGLERGRIVLRDHGFCGSAAAQDENEDHGQQHQADADAADHPVNRPDAAGCFGCVFLFRVVFEAFDESIAAWLGVLLIPTAPWSARAVFVLFLLALFRGRTRAGQGRRRGGQGGGVIPDRLSEEVLLAFLAGDFLPSSRSAKS